MSIIKFDLKIQFNKDFSDVLIFVQDHDDEKIIRHIIHKQSQNESFLSIDAMKLSDDIIITNIKNKHDEWKQILDYELYAQDNYTTKLTMNSFKSKFIFLFLKNPKSNKDIQKEYPSFYMYGSTTLLGKDDKFFTMSHGTFEDQTLVFIQIA